MRRIYLCQIQTSTIHIWQNNHVTFYFNVPIKSFGDMRTMTKTFIQQVPLFYQYSFT